MTRYKKPIMSKGHLKKIEQRREKARKAKIDDVSRLAFIKQAERNVSNSPLVESNREALRKIKDLDDGKNKKLV